MGDVDEGDARPRAGSASAPPAGPCAASGPGRRAARPAAAPGQVDQRPGQGHALLLATRELAGRRFASAARPTRSSSSSTRRSVSLSLDALAPRPKSTFSRRSGAGTARSSGRRCWWAACAPASRRRRRRRSATSPSLASSKPAIIRSVVVLPQPLGPSMVKNSPSPISRSSASTAVRSPNRLLTSRSSTAGAPSPARAAFPSVGFTCSLSACLPPAIRFQPSPWTLARAIGGRSHQALAPLSACEFRGRDGALHSFLSSVDRPRGSASSIRRGDGAESLCENGADDHGRRSQKLAAALYDMYKRLSASLT